MQICFDDSLKTEVKVMLKIVYLILSYNNTWFVVLFGSLHHNTAWITKYLDILSGNEFEFDPIIRVCHVEKK